MTFYRLLGQKKKVISVYSSLDEFPQFLKRLIASITNKVIEENATKAHLAIYSSYVDDEFNESPWEILISPAVKGANVTSLRAPVAETHPLTVDLNWQGLTVRSDFPYKHKESDTVLLWLDGKPLIFLRRTVGLKRLYINFALTDSNAARLPSFVLLIHRFIAEARNALTTVEQLNFGLGERVNLPPAMFSKLELTINEIQGGLNSSSISGSPSFIRAPEVPSYFNLLNEGKELLKAASYFSDSREADLRNANSLKFSPGKIQQLKIENSVGDNLQPLWIILLCFSMLAAWYYSSKSSGRSI